MNPKRLVLAILIAFVGVFLTDFLIHGVWLNPDYVASASLWRTEADMQKHFGWLLAGQFVAALTLTVLYAKGFADKACLKCAVMFGLFMGLFMQANTLIMFAVSPLPPGIAAKWFVAGTLQGAVIGLIVYYAYKPKAGGECKDGAC